MSAAAVPQVSVVIPTRNRRTLLGLTLAAVLAQRGVDLEVVVVDDGSTDDTAAWVTSVTDPRVRLVRCAVSCGVAQARNTGLATAAGTWVAFCDDDDLWAPGKLETQLTAAGRGTPWVAGGAVNFELWPPRAVAHGTAIPSVVLTQRMPAPPRAVAALPWRNVVPGGCSNVVARREVVAAVGGFDPQLRSLADWDLWLRLARVGPPAVVAAPLVAYRLHPGSMSADAAAVLAEFDRVAARGADLRDGRPADPAWLYRWLAQAALRSGDRRGALRAYASAVTRGDWSSLLRAVVATGGYPAARRLAARRWPVDPHWVEQVRPWLSAALAADQPATRSTARGGAPASGELDPEAPAEDAPPIADSRGQEGARLQ